MLQTISLFDNIPSMSEPGQQTSAQEKIIDINVKVWGPEVLKETARQNGGEFIVPIEDLDKKTHP